MEYTSTLLAVKNIELSKQFYKDVLGLDVIDDFGANVTLTGGISLQTVDSWKEFIHKQDNNLTFRNNVCELYFDEDDIARFAAKLSQQMILNLSIHFSNIRGVRESSVSTTLTDISLRWEKS